MTYKFNKNLYEQQLSEDDSPWFAIHHKQFTQNDLKKTNHMIDNPHKYPTKSLQKRADYHEKLSNIHGHRINNQYLSGREQTKHGQNHRWHFDLYNKLDTLANNRDK